MGLPEVLLSRRAVHPAEAVLPRRGIQARLAIERLLARPGFPIDGAGVVGQRVDARPVDVDGVLERLADGAAVARPREGDALEIRFADFPGSGRQQRRGIDEPRRKLLRGRVDAQQHDDRQHDAGLLRHVCLLQRTIVDLT